MIKNKYLRFLGIFIILTFLKANLAFAVEVDIGLGKNPTFPDYVSYLFNFAISVAAALALISFTIGAIGLINPNIEAHNDAKDRMKGAVLGLVLTLASFVIIKTINSDLIAPTSPDLKEVSVQNLKEPGVYFYLQDGCQGDNHSGAYTSSQDQIEDTYKGKMKSVLIINDDAKGIYYGAIFHKAPGLENGGTCSNPIVETNCTNVDSPFAADIFTINKNGSSGDGVNFYSNTYGWESVRPTGYFPISGGTIGSSIYHTKAPEIIYEYTGTPTTDPYRQQHKNFQTSPGSMQIVGDYLVAIYSGSSYCQTFTKNVPAFIATPVTKTGASLTDVYIAPYINKLTSENK